jgi:hypothetical protein
MSDDLVKRYQLDYHHARTYAEMAEDCDGDWVKYNDYKDAADRVEELEAMLAKAREEGFWAGRSCGGAKKEIDAALAELKGQE